MKILEFLEILDCLESLETLENQEKSEKEKRLLRLTLTLTLTLNLTDLYKKCGACRACIGLKRKKTDPDTDPEPDNSLQEARSLQLSALKKEG